MPGKYKKKNCPACGIEHRKKGIYCCQSCSNSARVITDESKKKTSNSMREYADTPEGIAAAKRAAIRLSAMQRGVDHDLVNIEDFAVDIPNIRSLDDYSDLIDGYDNAEKW